MKENSTENDFILFPSKDRQDLQTMIINTKNISHH